MINIVLVEPEIPQNAGNIVRTTAALGANLYMVKPLGFILDDKHFKRAGMDYKDFKSQPKCRLFLRKHKVTKNPHRSQLHRWLLYCFWQRKLWSFRNNFKKQLWQMRQNPNEQQGKKFESFKLCCNHCIWSNASTKLCRSSKFWRTDWQTRKRLNNFQTKKNWANLNSFYFLCLTSFLKSSSRLSSSSSEMSYFVILSPSISNNLSVKSTKIFLNVNL